LRLLAGVGWLIVTALATAGCTPLGSAAPQGFSEGTSAHTITVGGLERSYRLYVPSGLTVPVPLVVMLHGGFGSAEQAERSYGWDQLADSQKFVVVYPDGLGRAWNAGGGCCGRPGRDGIDDIGFITATVAHVSRNLDIDADRVYATGISNGGMMSYALACNSDMFAAIGPDSATQLDACSAPHPTSVLHIHGNADRMIPYGGGRGAGFAHIDGPAVADLNSFWRNVNRCGEPQVTVAGPVTTSSAGCSDGRAVELITLDGAGHQWPGSAPVRPGADPPSVDLDATSAFWRFFAQHSRG